MKILDDKAQGNQIILLLLFMMIMFFIMPTVGPILGVYFGLVLEPLIGFNGAYPVITLLFAGLIVVTLSSLLPHFFLLSKKYKHLLNHVKSLILFH